MARPILPPAPNPCGSCPYRRDVPSGIWEVSEYEKLLDYDLPTGEQPPAVFLCHRQDGRACAGWVAVHDMENSLGVRLASSLGALETPDVLFDYRTTTPVFASGAEAAAHGMEDINDPGPEAQRLMEKLRKAQDRRQQ